VGHKGRRVFRRHQVDLSITLEEYARMQKLGFKLLDELEGGHPTAKTTREAKLTQPRRLPGGVDDDTRREADNQASDDCGGSRLPSVLERRAETYACRWTSREIPRKPPAESSVSPPDATVRPGARAGVGASSTSIGLGWSAKLAESRGKAT
jgi:hypothetical protein